MFNNKISFREQRRMLGIFFLLALFLFITPLKSSVIRTASSSRFSVEITDSSFTSSTGPSPITGGFVSESAFPFPDEPLIRVAVYNEPNLTSPSYDGSFGFNTNNITALLDILSVNPRFDISLLTASEISGHILTTANFDVFIMLDNNPREFIVNNVLDFWLAGGGLLSFDSSAAFLAYSGILPPESAGDDGYSAIWRYSSFGYNFTVRHPIAKAYSLGTVIPADGAYGYASWNWTALSAFTIGGDLVPVAHSPTDENEITILAFDPTDRGGKVVSIGFDVDHESIPKLNQLIRNSINWLAPRPKARIAFDLSHLPRLGIDDWDEFSSYPGYYYGMRDLLVAHQYTVDKLFPVSSGDNFTLERLQKYDMLILTANDYNYTEGDRIAIEAWIANGGSLLAMTDRPYLSFAKPAQQANLLLSPFGLAVNISLPGVIGSNGITEFEKHPTIDGCSSITLSYYAYLNVSGEAFPIWKDGANIHVAGSEYGKGRVIFVSDINWLQSVSGIIDLTDNKQFLLNVANWLTASTAKVLMYTDWLSSPNFYRTPLALALNDLGVKYYLAAPYDAVNFAYLNLSLNLYSWDLVIIDNPSSFGLNNYFAEISDYIDSGGHLIMSYFNVDNYPANPLWAKLGFRFNATFSDQPPLYIWDAGHDIFSQPVDYKADNFTYGTVYFDDGDKLTIFTNATALAGITATEQTDEAVIVLRNDEQTLFNGYLLDEFSADTDDSTVMDSFELWKNEIAFMLRPKLTFTPSFPTTILKGNAYNYTIEMQNHGLTAARAGQIELILPTGFGTTTDPLVQSFTLPKDDTSGLTWSIQFDTVGNYTLTFEAIYQGFIGTKYEGGTLTYVISVTKTQLLPQYLWYIIGGVLGLILLIIIITVVIKKSKSKKS